MFGVNISGALPQSATWEKYTVTYSDFSTAANTLTVTIRALAANQIVSGCFIVPTTTFSGGTIASYTISCGNSGIGATTYSSARDVFTGASSSYVGTFTSVTKMASSNVTAIATCNGASALNLATQGSADIYILVSTLP